MISSDILEEKEEIITDQTERNLVKFRELIGLKILNLQMYPGRKLRAGSDRKAQEIAGTWKWYSHQKIFGFFPMISDRFLPDPVTFPLLSCRILRDPAVVIFDLGSQIVCSFTFSRYHFMESMYLFSKQDALFAFSFQALNCIHVTHKETKSSSRVFLKHLFVDLLAYLGLQKLNERLNDP